MLLEPDPEPHCSMEGTLPIWKGRSPLRTTVKFPAKRKCFAPSSYATSEMQILFCKYSTFLVRLQPSDHESSTWLYKVVLLCALRWDTAPQISLGLASEWTGTEWGLPDYGAGVRRINLQGQRLDANDCQLMEPTVPGEEFCFHHVFWTLLGDLAALVENGDVSLYPTG